MTAAARIIITLLFMLAPIPAGHAAQTTTTSAPTALDYHLFKTLPILDEGRLKPLQSFARIKLKTLSARETLPGLPAEKWLARMFFAPQDAARIPVFFLPNKTLAVWLNLSTDKHLYSLQELQPGLLELEPQITEILQTPETPLNKDQQALLTIYENVGLYMSLTQTVEILTTIEETANAPIAIKGWQNLAKAYKQNNNALWQSTLQEMNTSARANKDVDMRRFQTENLYRTLKPYRWVLGLYALGVALALIARHNMALLITTSALCGHSLTILARIYILDRPPVGTLYESVLFVSLICAAIGATIAYQRYRQNKHTTKDASPVIAGNISAFALLTIAPAIAPESDNLEVLSAVLNTNFWLTTHVLCITIGYAACILSATLAHIALIKKAIAPQTPFWRKAQKTIYKASIAALFFTTIGTILGGIWADQSWGRFWGWDPKENGALLIALWLIWIHHGRASGHIKSVGFTSLIACLNIIVAIAWFGVNLLNVGLHSYGFTSGMISGLAAFCVTEALLITALTITIKNKEKARPHAT